VLEIYLRKCLKGKIGEQGEPEESGSHLDSHVGLYPLYRRSRQLWCVSKKSQQAELPARGFNMSHDNGPVLVSLLYLVSGSSL